MDFYELSDQTLIEISKMSPLTWFRICEIVPFIGEWTPCPSTQRLVKRPFVEVIRSMFSWDTLPHTFWHLNGLRHRDGDLCGAVCSNGTEIWYKLGRIHRDGDLPAYICPDGYKEWYCDGTRIKYQWASKTSPTLDDRYQINKFIKLYYWP
jgi:hypothetical protein